MLNKNKVAQTAQRGREKPRPEVYADPEFLDLVLDAGNSTVKAVVLGNMVDFAAFAHAVRVETPAEYEARLATYRNQPTTLRNTAVFQTLMQPANIGGYVVGDQAERTGRPERIMGVGKYVAGHMDILMLAALQHFAPHGHSSVRVSIAYPPGAAMHIDRVKNCLVENVIPSVGTTNKKIHKIRRWDDEVVEYRIRQVSVWEEPIGGAYRFFTLPYAEYNQHDIEVGDRLLLVDIGGKISSMTPLEVTPGENFEVLTAQARYFDVGILDVKENLERELKTLYRDTFDSRQVPSKILNDALRGNGQAKVRGDLLDLSAAVTNAVGTLITALRRAFVSDLDKGVDISHIVCSGGGSGLLYDLMCAEVFKEHRHVHLADDRDNIQLANVRGGAHAFALYLAGRKRS